MSGDEIEQRNLAAVQNDGGAIRRIQNPSEAVQMAAVRNDPDAIAFIDKPSEAVQLIAVSCDGLAIRHIPDARKNVQKEAVRRDGAALQYIQNPDADVVFESVDGDGGGIWHIENPSEEIQLRAVERNPWGVGRIQNPSEAVQLMAVKNLGRVIRSIKNPSEAVQLMAVSNETLPVLGFMRDPGDAVCLAALRKSIDNAAELPDGFDPDPDELALALIDGFSARSARICGGRVETRTVDRLLGLMGRLNVNQVIELAGLAEGLFLRPEFAPVMRDALNAKAGGAASFSKKKPSAI